MKNMYKNKIVMYIVVNGKPQQETKNGVVVLPFSTEYSIAFKNKNNKRALVKFTIDGEEASGNGYIIPANETVIIERFHDVAKKFRFVDSDSPAAIADGKNNNSHEGLLVANFWLERDPYSVQLPAAVPFYGFNQLYDGYRHYKYATPKIGCALRGVTLGDSIDSLCSTNNLAYGNALSLNSVSVNNISAEPTSNGVSVESASSGVTVEGGNSKQNFGTSYFNTDYTTLVTIKLTLKGVSANADVALVDGQLLYANSPLASAQEIVKEEIAKLEAEKLALKQLEIHQLELQKLELQKENLRKEIESLKANLA